MFLLKILLRMFGFNLFVTSLLFVSASKMSYKNEQNRIDRRSSKKPDLPLKIACKIVCFKLRSLWIRKTVRYIRLSGSMICSIRSINRLCSSLVLARMGKRRRLCSISPRSGFLQKLHLLVLFAILFACNFSHRDKPRF